METGMLNQKEAKQSGKNIRIASIDLLRGLVMIIMALDHTRDFFHIDAWRDDPLNLETTTPALFLTRWITHFCAPVFVFLAGTSAWFQSQIKTKKELSSFLIKRGLWLILIEVLVINFAFSFDPGFQIISLQTIWSIGISMILLGFIIWLPFKYILAIAIAIIFGHNSLDFYEASHTGTYSLLYSILHHQGFYTIGDKLNIFIIYPVLPWAGLMIAGYCFGRLFTDYEGKNRNKILIRSGISAILFFIILRASNIYGDPDKWSQQKSLLLSIFNFIDTQKYPPSLLYMSMTIGPAILFLVRFGSVRNRISQIITVYGKVPFFYYILHFYLIHALSMIFFLTRGHRLEEGIHQGNQILPDFIISGEGYSLEVVYLVWIFVIICLYPLCKWYSEYKKNHKHWWLGYL